MKIRIRFSFLLFNAVLFTFRDIRLIMGFYVACAIHELGHIAAIRLTGGEVRTLELSCLGIRITSPPPVNLSAGLIVLLSGPALNLLTYGLLTAAGLKGFTAMFSLAEGAFNLLPFSFLDGGAALELASEGSKYERTFKCAINILRVLTMLTILAVLICALC